jgi:hypothetical protein
LHFEATRGTSAPCHRERQKTHGERLFNTHTHTPYFHTSTAADDGTAAHEVLKSLLEEQDYQSLAAAAKEPK